MVNKHGFALGLGAASLALSLFTGPALADGEPGSIKDEPVDEGRKFAVSITVGGTSDYVFRGVSQTLEDPAAQGSIDATYGIFYAGIWASNIDFGDAPKATAEIDLYLGVKPVWNNIAFDFGALYYAYPHSGTFPNIQGDVGHLDYFELKAGYTTSWIENLTTGTTVYWSPDYAFESGQVITTESTAAYTLPKFMMFTPTISALLGWQKGDFDEGFSPGGDPREDEFYYWNAGVSLAVEKFTFDFRYHDTDIDVIAPAGGTVCVASGLCDERFVFSAKVTLP